MSLLELDSVRQSFGGLHAVKDVSLEVEAGETVGIVGPNGAGKTVLLNCISGVYQPQAGRIRFEGTEVIGRRPEAMVRLGVSRTFQGTEHFSDFRALDYVLAGATALHGAALASWALRLPKVRRAERRARDEGNELLSSLGLAAVGDERLGDLPYGVQKRLDIARALMARPRLVLMDEPTSGTSAAERPELAEMVDRVHAQGVGVLVVDHDVDFIARQCRRTTVMSYGQVLAQGTPDEVLARPDVVAAFTGD